MVWLLGFLYTLHIVQSSLPSYKEIKGRTRWCLEEGKHCSVNLLQGFDFSLCCAPYACTTVLKDRKPNWLLSSEYKEYRCLLAPVPTINALLGANATNSTKEWKINVDQISENFNNKSTQTNISEGYESATSDSKSLNLEEQQSSESKNNSSESQSSYYSEENDIQQIVKRSTDTRITENLTFIEGPTIQKEKIQSLDNISLSLIGNSSEDLTRIRSNRVKSTENYEHFGSNKTESVEYSLSTNNSSELSTELSNTTVNAESVEISNIKDVKNDVTSLNSTYSATSSEVFSEEDWHSSDMQYDTRPMLRKVVTVLPFHFFDSVKVIRINESIETSAD